MTRAETENMILEEVRHRATLLDFPANEVHAGIDLIRSGLYDSMSFIDLIVAMEEKAGVEIDMEKFDPKEVSTPARLGDVIQKLKHA